MRYRPFVIDVAASVDISEVSGVSLAAALAKKTASQIEKETLGMAVVGSATVPTGIGGHSGSPYFTKIVSNFMEFHTRFRVLGNCGAKS